jgi:hypothetical protein
MIKLVPVHVIDVSAQGREDVILNVTESTFETIQFGVLFWELFPRTCAARQVIVSMDRARRGA